YRLAKECDLAKEKSREKVAGLIGAKPAEVFFTSCGTESDNLAIKGVCFANKERGNHIITSKIEHHAVLSTCKWLEKEGFEVSYIGVDKYGIVNLHELEKSITDKTILISIMYANNEVGTIEPIADIADIAKTRDIYFHTDAVQAVGKIPINIKDLEIDLLSLSAHKLYGPKGIGALYIKKGANIDPLLHGGHHERNKRAGTENVPGIVGLGVASEIASEDIEKSKEIKILRDKLEKGLLERIDDIKINGHPEKRLDGTLNLCIKYVEGESMLIHLDYNNIAASSGSACTSGSHEPSHVLTAMGISPEIAHGSLRFSLGKENTEEQVNKILETLPPIVEKLRAMSPLYPEG
ncbi:MAG: cysteine desulfurase NifS, partial [candidate division WOR-3 bacterium]